MQPGQPPKMIKNPLQTAIEATARERQRKAKERRMLADYQKQMDDIKASKKNMTEAIKRRESAGKIKKELKEAKQKRDAAEKKKKTMSDGGGYKKGGGSGGAGSKR
jgi:cell division septum initiation protein DivIVA